MIVDLERRAAELRAEFDRSFAEAASDGGGEFVDVIVVAMGEDRYAIRFEDVAGVHVGRAISPVPTASRIFTGLMGLRGLIVPVFDLAGLLGYAVAERPRWVLLLRHASPVGVCLERFEAHRRIAVADVKNSGVGSDDSRASRGGIVDAGVTIPLLHLHSLLEIIERARSKAPIKGR